MCSPSATWSFNTCTNLDFPIPLRSEPDAVTREVIDLVGTRFADHFGEFVLGLLRSEAVVFYLIVSAIALALNASYLEWRR